ncbi:MAG: CPBP family intramembrane metalloprotease [Bacteroidetes bacterium]|nr:CPBP family intramembrane metalloprotease [Rhodothermia bacterium]MCS7154757.1 CPBP family intramembrane metalloprotease [Bacteroidota bacterium]MCX7907086.1 CPBP family intramembrane metalloprotease [Bacteroidota bacterium]MDW8137550.1 CPBP family intramembrane glutamic endopeptidase [Bacteroidota bacterium]MDW8285496.1 CPBP family intramembrane glutamic endopeptidase [Bacteroidota bacterium]
MPDSGESAIARLVPPLDGWLERHRLPPWLLGLGWSFLAWMLFQAIGSVLLLSYLWAQHVDPGALWRQEPLASRESARALLLVNALAQVLVLGLPTLLLARLHSSRPGLYLRLERPDGGLFVLALGLIFVVQPCIQLLADWNARLPLPEGYKELERRQLELLFRALQDRSALPLHLVLVAAIPALCEELLFRGYVLRNLMRTWPLWAALLVSGLLFGLYHLRLTQVLPLALLGVLLGYLVWRTGSVWTAVAVHFANNGATVLVAALRPDWVRPDTQEMLFPWYAVLLALPLLGLLLYAFERRARGLYGRAVA